MKLKIWLIAIIVFKWKITFSLFKLLERYKNWWLKILGASALKTDIGKAPRKPVAVIDSDYRERAARTRNLIKKREEESKIWTGTEN